MTNNTDITDRRTVPLSGFEGQTEEPSPCPGFTIKFASEGRQAVISGEESLLLAVAAADIPLKASCGGKGVCNGCRLLLKEGKVRLSDTGKLTEEDLAAGYIPACRSFPESDLVVEVPGKSRLNEHRVLLDDLHEDFVTDGSSDSGLSDSGLQAKGSGSCAASSCQPAYKKITLKVPQPSPDDAEDDLGRLFRVLREKTGIEHLRINLDSMRVLPGILRKANWEVAVHLSEAQGFEDAVIEQIEPSVINRKIYGLAVDIGTTTVVADLVDLENGVSLGVRGTHNRQAIFGDDVINRIIYAGDHPGGLQELQRAAVVTVNRLIDDLLETLRLSRDDVKVAVCSGNTTMAHLFFGLEPEYIRLEPYIPAANTMPAVRARQLGLKIHPGAWVQFLPGVASYIGGDITAGVLLTGMAERGEMSLLIDAGTNGEMVLGNKEWMIGCSCSAGPAFEGSGVRCGARAVKGAIEQISVALRGAQVEFRTIGGAPPVGICGSGLIDCLASLYKAGVIDRAGRFIAGVKCGRLREGADGPEFVICRAAESGSGEDITISEQEIKNLIRSKAAVFAGVRSMLSKTGLPLEAVSRIFIAGGFGRYVNIRQAVAIGLLPDLPEEKYTYIGNSSVKGAKMALLSREARRKAQTLARRITYLDLSADNTFYEEFVAALFLPHTDLNLFPSLL